MHQFRTSWKRATFVVQISGVGRGQISCRLHKRSSKLTISTAASSRQAESRSQMLEGSYVPKPKPAAQWRPVWDLAVFYVGVVAQRFAFVQLTRATDFHGGVGDHFFPLRHPAHGAAEREDGREHGCGEAHRL